AGQPASSSLAGPGPAVPSRALEWCAAPRAFFFSSRGRHTRSYGDWSSDVCSSDLTAASASSGPAPAASWWPWASRTPARATPSEIGRASCRERVSTWEVADDRKKKVAERIVTVRYRGETTDAPHIVRLPSVDRTST